MIVGKISGGVIHPIYNQRLQIIGIDSNTRQVKVLVPAEIRQIPFNIRFPTHNNNAGESSTSNRNQHRNH